MKLAAGITAMTVALGISTACGTSNDSEVKYVQQEDKSALNKAAEWTSENKGKTIAASGLVIGGGYLIACLASQNAKICKPVAKVFGNAKETGTALETVAENKKAVETAQDLAQEAADNLKFGERLHYGDIDPTSSNVFDLTAPLQRLEANTKKAAKTAKTNTQNFVEATIETIVINTPPSLKERFAEVPELVQMNGKWWAKLGGDLVEIKDDAVRGATRIYDTQVVARIETGKINHNEAVDALYNKQIVDRVDAVNRAIAKHVTPKLEATTDAYKTHLGPRVDSAVESTKTAYINNVEPVLEEINTQFKQWQKVEREANGPARLDAVKDVVTHPKAVFRTIWEGFGDILMGNPQNPRKVYKKHKKIVTDNPNAGWLKLD